MTSVAVYAILSLGSLLTAAPGPLRSLRTGFWHDQLGYLSIVADVAAGDFANREPVTQTGVNHYPRIYYTSVGVVAHLFRIEPVLAWNAVSLLFQIAAVACLALALARVSGRAWMAFLAPLPYFAGVMSFAQDGGWFRSLESHAVLWGPYGVMYSNNAETAGLSVVIICLSLLAMVWLRPTGRVVRIGTTVIVAALLGVLSGFQTYSFISGAYLVAYLLAARFLLPSRRGWWLLATAIGVALVFLLGPTIAARAGQLPTLIFGLLPAVPGLLRGLVRTRGALAAYAAVFAAAAVPQIAWTMSGVLSGDPFLTYRVASNVDLGVVRPDTLVASVAVAAPLVTILALAWWRRRPDCAGFAAAVLGSWVVLSLNDLWGANAEPYRFWIDMFLLGAVVAAIAAARLYARPAADTETTPVTEVDARRPRRGARTAQVVAWSVCAVLYGASLTDYAAFRADPAMSATWSPAAEREAAIADLAAQAGADGSGLVLTDPCIDPRTTKVSSAAPLAFYYVGMAWPLERDAVQSVMTARDRATTDAGAMREAGVAWIVTDSRCDRSLGIPSETRSEVASRSYGNDSGTLTLWRYEVK